MFSEINLKYLGSKILTARTECQLSQRELAKQTNMSTKTLQDIERGCKNPTYKALALRFVDFCRMFGRLLSGIPPAHLRLQKFETNHFQVFGGVIMKEFNSNILFLRKFYNLDKNRPGYRLSSPAESSGRGWKA